MFPYVSGNFPKIYIQWIPFSHISYIYIIIDIYIYIYTLYYILLLWLLLLYYIHISYPTKGCFPRPSRPQVPGEPRGRVAGHSQQPLRRSAAALGFLHFLHLRGQGESSWGLDMMDGYCWWMTIYIYILLLFICLFASIYMYILNI